MILLFCPLADEYLVWFGTLLLCSNLCFGDVNYPLSYLGFYSHFTVHITFLFQSFFSLARVVVTLLGQGDHVLFVV